MRSVYFLFYIIILISSPHVKGRRNHSFDVTFKSRLPPITTTTTTSSTTAVLLRGGGASDLPNASTYWSRTRTATSPSSPTSFSNRQSHQQHKQSDNIKVTDVTQEIKTQEQQQTKESIDEILTRDNRNTFIARVYSILAVQLLFTIASVFAFAKHPKLVHWVLAKGKILPNASILLSTLAFFRMAMSETARRSSPMKWILLATFTFGKAFMVGLISSFYKSKTVISALTSTFLALISVTGYTLLNRNPKYDLSQWGTGLASMSMIMLSYLLIHVLSLIGWLPPGFLPYNEIVFSILGCTLFTLFLAYDTRLIVSGKHTKYQLNQKDYVFGAALLYHDIVAIFLYLLKLLDNDDRGS